MKDNLDKYLNNKINIEELFFINPTIKKTI